MQKEMETNGIFVSAEFITQKMHTLDEVSLKVYLQAKLLCETSGGRISCDVLYQIFGDVKLVQDALRNLVKKGFLLVSKEAMISFAALSTPRGARYDHKQIAQHIDEDQRLQMLMQAAEVLWARTLNASDVKGLYSLHDWLGFPVEVILKLLEYCAEIGKNSMSYIEKVAIAWHSEGISTLEAAESKIESELQKHTYIYKAKRIFGTGEHNFSTSQKEYLLKWQGMGVSEQLLSFAFDYTIDNAGKLAFPYMDKVLCAWIDSGVKTPQQAQQYIDDYKKETKQQPEVKTKTQNRRVNYETNQYDYDELRRLARRNIRQKLGKE